MTYNDTKLTIPNEQTRNFPAFLALSKFLREEIMGGMEQPPGLGGVLEYATLANFGVMTKMFWMFTGIPLVNMVDGAFNNQWLRRHFPKEYADGYYIEHDTSGIEALQENELEKAQIEYTQAQMQEIWIRNKIKTRNEVREEIGLEPVEGGDEFAQDVNPFQGFSLMMPSEPDSGGNGHKKNEPINRKMQVYDIKYHEKRLTGFEEEFSEKVADYFRGQKKRVLVGIESDATIGMDMAPMFEQNGGTLTVAKVAVNSIDDWFIIQEEIDKMIEEILPELERIYGQAGQDALVNLDLDMIFDMDNPKVLEFINTKYGTLFPDVTEYTRRVLSDILSQASSEGWSITEIQKTISDLFDGWIEGTPDSMSRALRIARTEMNSVVNNADLNAWLQADIVTMKSWLNAGDSHVRDSHRGIADANKNDWFHLPDGNVMMCPGDPAGGPENVINCRCGMAPVLEAEE
jgi:hypothetical protein